MSDVTGKKLLISNVVYGKIYSEIFVDIHLPSVIQALRGHEDGVTYWIFTDRETLNNIFDNPVIKQLENLIGKNNVLVSFIPDDKMKIKYENRYSVITYALRETVKRALADEVKYVCPWVGDLCIGATFFDKVFSHLNKGYDSVFMHPIRSAYEPMKEFFDLRDTDKLDVNTLFYKCFENMHPLWVHCHVESPQFTKIPDTLLWNSGTGLLARSFSITPIIFKPTPAMAKARGVIDIAIPPLCENPYWCEDWIDAPVTGVEPLFCFYPPFYNFPFQIEALSGSHYLSRLKFAEKKMFYPSKKEANIPKDVEIKSDKLLEDLKCHLALHLKNYG